MEFVIFDTETTGLMKPAAVELAWLHIGENLEVLSEFETRVNPEKPIEAGATAVHGITDKDVEFCLPVSHYVPDIPSNNAVAHNISFDVRVMRDYWVPSRQLCTLALARQFIKDSANHKLQTLKAHLGLPDTKAHSALGDVYTTYELLRHILSITGKTVDELFTAATKQRVIHVMPFGKYKGVLLHKIPRDYRNWLLEQDVDKDLKYSLERLKDL